MSDPTSNPQYSKRRRLYSTPDESENPPSPEITALIPMAAEPRTLNRPNLRSQARKVVHQFSLMAAGAGVLPLAIVSVGAGAAIHVVMTMRLAALYGISLDEKGAQLLAAAAVSGIGSEWLGAGAAKQIVLTSWLGSVVSSVVVPGGLTYALGYWLIRHFESTAQGIDSRHLSP